MRELRWLLLLLALCLPALGALAVYQWRRVDVRAKFKPPSPQPVPQEIVEAWHNSLKLAGTDLAKEALEEWRLAGAEFGWMNKRSGRFVHFQERAGVKADELPAFDLVAWREWNVARLPDPGAPFGLHLYLYTEVSNLGGIVDFENLHMLDLGGRSNVTDANVMDLANASNLRYLSLMCGPRVTDRSLEGLKGLAHLEALDLTYTSVTGKGMSELVGLKYLKSLTLESTQISDAGLKEIGQLKNLQTLKLGGTAITDAGLSDLVGLQKLLALDLSGGGITDSGLGSVAKMNSLQSLDLSYTEVADGGVKQLAILKNLRSLNLEGTSVTKAGISQFQANIPLCKIRPSP